jgi:hypothetical protein
VTQVCDNKNIHRYSNQFRVKYLGSPGVNGLPGLRGQKGEATRVQVSIDYDHIFRERIRLRYFLGYDTTRCHW